MNKVLVVLTALVMLAALAVAAETGGNLMLRDTVQLNGKQLTPGEYKVQWEGTGPSVQVTVTLRKKTVMKTTGTIKELDKAADNDSIMYRGADGKTKEVTQISFAGKKTVLVFEGQPPATN